MNFNSKKALNLRVKTQPSKWRKRASLLLPLFFVVGLAACGGDTVTGPSYDMPAPSQPVAATPTPTPSPTPDPTAVCADWRQRVAASFSTQCVNRSDSTGAYVAWKNTMSYEWHSDPTFPATAESASFTWAKSVSNATNPGSLTGESDPRSLCDSYKGLVVKGEITLFQGCTKQFSYTLPSCCS